MSLKKNILANYFGQGWSVLMGLAFVPLYIQYLGMESYGLIGVFAVLQTSLIVLDMGLTPALSREMTRFSAGAHSSQSIRNVLRTLECLYGLLTLMVPILVWWSAFWLAKNWLKTEKLSPEVVAEALVVMGVVVALRLWESLYKGALQGLQQMVWLNIAIAVLATLRWGGAVLVLAWVSPNIKTFFLWQGGISLLSTGLFAMKIYSALPSCEQGGRFSRQTLLGLVRFSGGLTAIALLVLLLTQIDKIMLSSLLSLEFFGYYTLAATVGNALFHIIAPLTSAIYPRFTELVTHDDQVALAETYHRACQLMSVLIIPPALTLAFFAEPVLVLWTHNSRIAQEAAPIVVPLVLGTLCNGFMNLPYMLQLAHGWTGLTIRVNVVAVIIIVPAIMWATSRYGSVGAGYAWFALNAGYLLIDIPLMHRRLLPMEKWSWYLNDIGLPLIGTASVGAMLWGLTFIAGSERFQMGLMIAVGFVLFFVAVISANRLRSEATSRVISWTRESSWLKL
jgi:O-antigen/teichoic acid export membrane protein